MSDLISNIKKYFIKFSIVGVANTIIHLLIFNAVLLFSTIVVSQLVAFVIASVFSYFANVKFTYKKSFHKTTFTLVMITFTVKLLLNGGLAFGFEQLLIQISLIELNPIIPLFITAMLLPIQFIIFNLIFKVNKDNDLEMTNQAN